MGFLKHKNFFIGLLFSLILTGMIFVFLLLFLSEMGLKETLRYFYQEDLLGGLISLAALINLPVFFIALRRKLDRFAFGILCSSLLIVVGIAILKLQS